MVLITWNIFCHSLLAWSISIEKSAAGFIRAPLYVTSCFSLAAFKILSLSWKFAVLIMMCLGVGLFGFLLIGTLCHSWICVTFSLIRLGKFSIITFSNRFSIPCSSSSPSGIPIMWILLRFMLSCTSLNPSSFFLSLFLFLALSRCLFYFVLQCPDPILCLIKSAFDSFYCVLQFRNCILHFLLSPVDSLYFLFHVDIVCNEFIVVSL